MIIVLKLTKLAYVFYFVFLCISVSVTTMTTLDILPGFIFMCILMIIFKIGYITAKPRKKVIENKDKTIANFDKIKIILMFLVVVFSLSVTWFYTGQTVLSVLQNLKGSESLYSLYQKHHFIMKIGEFSFKKLPFIVMLFLMKFIVVYSYVLILIIKTNTSLLDKLFLLLGTLSYLFFGLARGTNFEVFELSILVFYIIIQRNQSSKSKSNEFNKIILIFIFSMLGLFIFSKIISYRGNFGYYISPMIKYDSTAILSKMLPNISLLISGLTMYFGHGFYYITAFMKYIWIDNMKMFLFGFLPFGFKVSGISNLQDEINFFADPGTNWRPDIIPSIETYGVILIIFIFFGLGSITKKVNSNIENNKDWLALLTNYYLILQMISFPIGNFIAVSSSNLLIVFTLIIFWFRRFLVKKSRLV